jgi:hypothetical protein
MPVKYLDWFTRDGLRAEPDARFVFGDNCRRVGYGGQAAVCRDEPNAIGVATLYAPGRFYRADDPAALAHVAHDLFTVAAALADSRTVYVPRDGLGTGLARLPEHAPNLHRLIVAFFRAAPGEPCPWKD